MGFSVGAGKPREVGNKMGQHLFPLALVFASFSDSPQDWEKRSDSFLFKLLSP